MSRLTHRWSYHEVVAAEYGPSGLLALRLAIIVNNAGSMVGGRRHWLGQGRWAAGRGRGARWGVAGTPPERAHAPGARGMAL